MQTLTYNLVEVLGWREWVEKSDFVQCKGYTRQSILMDGFSASQLDLICEAANNWWKLNGSSFRVNRGFDRIFSCEE